MPCILSFHSSPCKFMCAQMHLNTCMEWNTRLIERSCMARPKMLQIRVPLWCHEDVHSCTRHNYSGTLFVRAGTAHESEHMHP